jgi:4a-hydroxytetrahydrobiopterin dehydratase
MAETLTGDAREAGLAALPGWALAPDRDAISRSFRFAGFTEAFAFMTAVALEASGPTITRNGAMSGTGWT